MGANAVIPNAKIKRGGSSAWLHAFVPLRGPLFHCIQYVPLLYLPAMSFDHNQGAGGCYPNLFQYTSDRRLLGLLVPGNRRGRFMSRVLPLPRL